MYHVYMVRCADGSHYTGLASALENRMREHVGRLPACARYTRSRPVVALDALWRTPTRADAARLEALIKTLTKPQKLALIESPGRLADFFPGRLDPDRYEAVPNPSLDDYL